MPFLFLALAVALLFIACPRCRGRSDKPEVAEDEHAVEEPVYANQRHWFF
jgi:hypothetical protein